MKTLIKKIQEFQFKFLNFFFRNIDKKILIEVQFTDKSLVSLILSHLVIHELIVNNSNSFNVNYCTQCSDKVMQQIAIQNSLNNSCNGYDFYQI